MNIIQNTWSVTGQGADVSWLSPKVAQKVRAFHCQVPGYAPTPLKPLPELAEECGVKALLVKDESPRQSWQGRGLGGGTAGVSGQGVYAQGFFSQTGPGHPGCGAGGGHDHPVELR